MGGPGHRPQLAWAGFEGGLLNHWHLGPAPQTGCCLLAAKSYQNGRPGCMWLFWLCGGHRENGRPGGEGSMEDGNKEYRGSGEGTQNGESGKPRERGTE